MRTFLVCMVLGMSFTVHAAPTEVQRVIDSAGGTSSSPTYILTDAVGQGQPIGYAHSTVYLSSAGFLHSATNEPTVNADQDSDSLTDWMELTGNRFSPNTPTDPRRSDSDGDGLSDEREIQTGTDPMDAESSLRFTSITEDGTNLVVRLKWAGRQGLQYAVLAGTTVANLATNPTVVANVVGGMGAGEWFATECESVQGFQQTNMFYKVRLTE